MLNLPPLNTKTIWAIINDEIDDDIVHQLVWYYLGYRYDQTSQTWDNSQVDEYWQDYSEPPKFLESRRDTLKLTRSIPQEYKQIIKEKLGFKGYKIDELVPRKTRRASIANWLLSYLEQHPGQ